MTTTAITKTLGPIHFEDLDPHRFEDLVRELIYDLKEWQSIEATGRGGGDDGFDIRAYERIDAAAGEQQLDEEDGAEELRPMEGNLWMFQCKREKALGPARVADIIAESINPKSPPYGYVLVAPANFSKKAFDTFREELRRRGVMEFYLWGRAALEDLLHLPKNDHVLFTFFGISLVSRRKSRSTEIRAVVSAKNKLMRILGEDPHHAPILMRDTKDRHYPYEGEISDFQTRPRWKEYSVVELNPLGLVLRVASHFAYWDGKKREWDMTTASNLVARTVEDEDVRQERQDIERNVRGFWEFFPYANRATYVRNGLIRFDAISVIDEKGDSLYKFPHLFVDFQGDRGPFAGFWEFLKIDERHYEELEGLRRVKLFPTKFGKPRIGTIHRDKAITLDERSRELLKRGSRDLDTLYDCDGKLTYLNEGDVVAINGTEERGGGKPVLVKITNKRSITGKVFLAENKDRLGAQLRVEQQIGRSLAEKDKLIIYEFMIVYEWQLKDAAPM